MATAACSYPKLIKPDEQGFGAVTCVVDDWKWWLNMTYGPGAFPVALADVDTMMKTFFQDGYNQDGDLISELYENELGFVRLFGRSVGRSVGLRSVSRVRVRPFVRPRRMDGVAVASRSAAACCFPPSRRAAATTGLDRRVSSWLG